MSGKEKRSDGPFGERGHERRCAQSAPPVLYVTALLLDSTTKVVVIRVALRSRGRRSDGITHLKVVAILDSVLPFPQGVHHIVQITT
jgi:hypothetical protein